MTKFTKEKANYRTAEQDEYRCGTCIHFQPFDKTRQFGTCTLVIGHVSSEGLCDLWEPDPLQEPGDIIYEKAKRDGVLREMQENEGIKPV